VDMFRLDGRVAIVTGGSRGIGLGIAKAFAQAGAHVVLTARTENTLRDAAADIQAAGGSAEYFAFDAADLDAGQQVVEQVATAHGRLDILVNNAGLNFREPAAEITVENFDRVHAVNLRGPLFLARAAGNVMLAQGTGKIINIASLSSFLGLAKLASYATSKAAILQMTKVMATEWAERNVQVNAIAPGFIVTDLNRKLWDRDDVRNWVLGNTPARRLGTVEDCVGAAVFLASAASDYITGQVITVDGGLMTGGAWPL
jgi:NAD(P)-dependent dehydrogenase (short-subunit alcohol dehydrogenase family)